jgi:hypothetical protein
MIERISYPKGQKRYKTPMILRSLCGRLKSIYSDTISHDLSGKKIAEAKAGLGGG